jgi:hypothetical protein
MNFLKAPSTSCSWLTRLRKLKLFANIALVRLPWFYGLITESQFMMVSRSKLAATRPISQYAVSIILTPTLSNPTIETKEMMKNL